MYVNFDQMLKFCTQFLQTMRMCERVFVSLFSYLRLRWLAISFYHHFNAKNIIVISESFLLEHYYIVNVILFLMWCNFTHNEVSPVLTLFCVCFIRIVPGG